MNSMLQKKTPDRFLKSIRSIPFFVQDPKHPFVHEGYLNIQGRSSDFWIILMAAPSHQLQY